MQVSPLLANQLDMDNVRKATSSSAEDLYHRLVAGLDRKLAKQDGVKVLDELEACFGEVVAEEVHKRIGVHPAAGQGW